MFVSNIKFIVIAVLCTFFRETSSECKKLTNCSCKLLDGQIIDISYLTAQRPLKAEKDNYTYYFYPCRNEIITDVSIKPDNECSKPPGVSVCVNVDNVGTYALGTVESMTMNIPANPNTDFVLMFTHKTAKAERMTNIFVKYCDDQCQPKLTADLPTFGKEGDSESYVLYLVIPKANNPTVHRGLSTGSLLVIIFFVFGGLYFIGGAFVLKLLRGATDWEMLPNHEFWCALPSLVRDGIVFTFNCCRVDSYDRI